MLSACSGKIRGLKPSIEIYLTKMGQGQRLGSRTCVSRRPSSLICFSCSCSSWNFWIFSASFSSCQLFSPQLSRSIRQNSFFRSSSYFSCSASIKSLRPTWRLRSDVTSSSAPGCPSENRSASTPRSCQLKSSFK